MTWILQVDEAAIEAGIYVIIDWHIEQDAYKYVDDAVAFFRQMATDYGQYPHVIYKLWNEPPQVGTSQESVVQRKRLVRLEHGSQAVP